MKSNMRSILVMMCLLAIGSMWAKSIDESQASRIAAAFMHSHAMPTATMRMALKAPQLNAPATSGKAAYYVFNAGQRGYVIIAGDDRVPAVLAYGDQGAFDAQDVPEAMQELLDSYADQIDALDHGAKVAQHLNHASPIAPLVTAVWSQNNPYNILLPMLPTGKHAYVGCVATAMAQVMHYWKWPARPLTAIPQYTSETLSIYMPQLPIVDFDWNNMHVTYETDDTTSTAALAAARLSLYCAQSVTMDFKKTSSSAYSSDIPWALIYYYGYKSTAKYLKRLNYTTTSWENLIYQELEASRPVLYSGSKASGGHAFVCDGYDGDGRFHINWGWNGTSNGYFLLNVLNPDEQGTGSADGSYGYIYSQGIITGVEPGTAPDNLEITSKYIELQTLNGSRSSAYSNFTLTQMTHFLNHNTDPVGFDYGWALYQDNTMKMILETGTRDNLDSYYYLKATRTLSFGSGLTSGTFRIVPIYSEIGANNWRPCIGSDINYIEVTINGNSCSAICHGTSGSPIYSVNNIDVSGTMHPNRPVNITVNVTNNGNTRGDLIYMFANDEFFGTAFVDLEHGESGNATFMYSQENAGSASLTFCLDEDGKNVIGSRSIQINQMPTANLNGSVEVLNVTDPVNKIITSDKFSVKLTVTNRNSQAYDEDITIKLYKHTYGNYGTLVQTQNRRLYLPANQSTTIQFDLDNVIDGWQYFIKTYYYSNGEQVSLKGCSTHTIVFPNSSAFPKGDVNGDDEVNIADINAVISIILGGSASADVLQRADVDKNNEINIADVNAIINIIQH